MKLTNLSLTVEKAKYYYIAGFFLTVSTESIALVAEHAAAQNKVKCKHYFTNFYATLEFTIRLFFQLNIQTSPGVHDEPLCSFYL